ncbi:MAG: 5-formyltetrahydrofolate cyclo-ligase [Aquificae bacterium]|nr:5-formyltetrahydrofolate cyclo-ligase [Aquificota bacterium]
MVKELKEHLRRELIERRRRLPEEERRRQSASIVERLKKLPAFKRAKTVLLYYPLGGEVDLRPLLEELLKDPKKVLLLPKTTVDGRMVAVEVNDKAVLKKGRHGVVEPLGGRIFKPEKVDLVVVPGVAFDERGCRLGRGGGFYDRFLPRVKGFKVGVAYDFQLLKEVPCEEHDAPLDAVITPTKVYYRKKEE